MLAELIPHSFCQRQLVVPLKLEGRRLLLAMADPLDEGLIDEVRFTAGLDLKVVTADTAAIRKKISELYGDSSVNFKELETLVGGPDPYEGIEIVIEERTRRNSKTCCARPRHRRPSAWPTRSSSKPSASALPTSTSSRASRASSCATASTACWPTRSTSPHHLHQSLVSRLKIMSELDISERRRPQDGRITVKTPMRMVNLRISTLPTINGEKVVMRILDRNSTVHTLDRLGFSPSDLPRVADMVAKPQGIILATGPTGSGKTTTLYSLLQHDATPDKNYVTIEDPVEYYLDMAGQVLVREKIGLTFPQHPARPAAPGPGCHPARRDPRLRDRRSRLPRRADRAPGLFDPAHQLGHRHHRPPVRPRPETLCRRHGAGGHHRPAPGAPDLPALPRGSAG